MINSKAKQILIKAFEDAIDFLKIPSYKYRLIFERKGHNLKNNDVCVANHTKRIIFIDEDWANNSISMKFEYDLHFLMAHEARHIYQLVIMERYKKQKTFEEPLVLVQSWIDNSASYVRDIGGSTAIIYKNQPLEIDANAFASFFVMMKYNESPSFSKGAEEIEKKRLYEIAHFYGATIYEK